MLPCADSRLQWITYNLDILNVSQPRVSLDGLYREPPAHVFKLVKILRLTQLSVKIKLLQLIVQRYKWLKDPHTVLAAAMRLSSMDNVTPNKKDAQVDIQ